MRDIEKFKEEILKEYPRLSEDSTFKFACHPGVPCFNDCCGDVNIFLTPYDILRLKKNLNMSSEKFLADYTIIPFDKELKYPIVLLQMQDDDKKSCPFVGENGCTVYEDRPWACRMYPLGMASPKEGGEGLDDEFYFLLEESFCKGFNEENTLTVADWMENQGINEYNKMGYYFKELTLHDFFQDGSDVTPEKIEMFFLACYNLDAFRDFLFSSTFFDKFEIDDATKELIKSDDVELLKFSYTWLRFALFGEKTLKIKSDVLEAKKQNLKEKKKP
jgi:Fe-S-cluster containining protein